MNTNGFEEFISDFKSFTEQLENSSIFKAQKRFSTLLKMPVRDLFNQKNVPQKKDNPYLTQFEKLGLKTIQERVKFKALPSNKWLVKHDKDLIQISIRYNMDWKKISRHLKRKLNLNMKSEFFKQRFYLIQKTKIYRSNIRFTQQEDDIITLKSQEYGLNWEKIAEFLPQRSPTMIRNRYFYSKKKLKKDIHLSPLF